MKPLKVTVVRGGLRFDDFPNAAKIVKLSCPKAKRTADLALHLSDMGFAIECLEGINQVPEEPKALREGLWRSAIVHFMKCFGRSESRFSLAAKKVYKSNPEALQAFDYFRALRDKHLVHDENSHAQCRVGAVLNKRNADYKIERILSWALFSGTLDQANYNNLHLLITTARQWVEKQHEELSNVLTRDLEALAYDDLFNREQLKMPIPKTDEIDRCRLSH